MAAIVTILDYRSESFELFLIYKSYQWFIPGFKSAGLSDQEKKWKIDFQEAVRAAILDYQP